MASVFHNLNFVVGAVADARNMLDAFCLDVLHEVRQGRIVSYRGHEWGTQHLQVLNEALAAAEAAFNLVKYLQFPENRGRLNPERRFIMDLTKLKVETLPSSTRGSEYDELEAAVLATTLQDGEWVNVTEVSTSKPAAIYQSLRKRGSLTVSSRGTGEGMRVFARPAPQGEEVAGG